MYTIQQSTASNPLMFMMILTSDHISAYTGGVPSVQLSKAGNAFAVAAGAVTNIGLGAYGVVGNATDSNTLGPLWLHASASSADPTDTVYHIVGYNPFTNTLGMGIPNNFATMNINASGYLSVITNADKTGYTASTVSDKTGYSLTQNFPTNFASFLISSSGYIYTIINADKTGYTVSTNQDKTGYTVSTVSDKTGYSLTQNFPSRFASMLISTSGYLSVDTISDKTGYSLTQTFPSNFSVLVVDASGSITAGAVATGAQLAVGKSVWDVPMSSHVLASTTGAQLNTAGSAGDPWTTALPGAYGGGTAGNIVGNNLNTTVGSRLAAANVPPNFSNLFITSSGYVAVATNLDKNAYSLVQAFPTNFPSLLINSSGFVSIQSGIKKNTALANFEFLMTDSTNHNPATGLTVTANRSIDGGALAGCANAVTELSNGIYKISLAASDLNGAVITLRFTATSADDLDVTVVPDP